MASSLAARLRTKRLKKKRSEVEEAQINQLIKSKKKKNKRQLRRMRVKTRVRLLTDKFLAARWRTKANLISTPRLSSSLLKIVLI